MTGQHERPKRYEYLKDMSIEELETLLTSDDLHLENEDEFYDAVGEEIVRREREAPTGRIKNVDEAWQEFLAVYHSPEREGALLFPEGEAEAPDPASGAAFAGPEKGRKWRRAFSVQRLAAAAVLALSITALLPPALGYESFAAMIGHWNDTVFHFGLAGQESDTPSDTLNEYSSLDDALLSNGVTAQLAPKIPQGFEISAVDVERYSDLKRTDFSAFYQCEERNISIYIIQRDEPVMVRSYEKDETLVEVYSINGIEHYIYENNGRISANWYIDVFECSIRGDISVDDTKMMINSIYERL